MGWFYYLKGKLKFPFKARCTHARAIFPLRPKDEVVVSGMPPEEEYLSEMFVTIRWSGRGLAVPLSQLLPVRPTDQATRVAVEDWHYWVFMGYSFALVETPPPRFSSDSRMVRGEFLLQRHYPKDRADSFMMQLMVDDHDAWWKHLESMDLASRFGVKPPKAPVLQPRALRVVA